MTDMEITLTDLGEVTTIEIAKEKNPIGIEENIKVAKLGGEAAKAARNSVEKTIGKTVISNKNKLSYEYIEDKKAIESK